MTAKTDKIYSKKRKEKKEMVFKSSAAARCPKLSCISFTLQSWIKKVVGSIPQVWGLFMWRFNVLPMTAGSSLRSQTTFS